MGDGEKQKVHLLLKPKSRKKSSGLRPLYVPSNDAYKRLFIASGVFLSSSLLLIVILATIVGCLLTFGDIQANAKWLSFAWAGTLSSHLLGWVLLCLGLRARRTEESDSRNIESISMPLPVDFKSRIRKSVVDALAVNMWEL